MFNRILVANRGEIALRVIRACRDLGVDVAVVYSEADRDAPYLKLADKAVCIGPGPAAESYLKVPRIIAAAEVAGADAVHPGYGFLSENADFAEKCRACGIEFIGPPEAAMRQVGNKDRAKQLAKSADVQTVPGSDGLIESEDEALAFARSVGYPVLIKAAAGGGGRGMRVARSDESLVSGLSQARQEAEAAFKDGSVYLEKYLDRPRHIEVQLLGDKHGNIVHLYERDCSLQRRHQKLVEEAPAPNLPAAVREAICTAAVRLARAANYYSAGTCEFLLDKDHNFYFIEVNARIQVEHPVSELITGIDLIKQANPASPPANGCRSPRTTSASTGPRSSAGSTPRTRPRTSARRPGRSPAGTRPAGRASASTATWLTGLPGAAELRQHGRQAPRLTDRLGPKPWRPCGGPRGVRRRRNPHDNPTPPGHHERRRVRRHGGGHDLYRTRIPPPGHGIVITGVRNATY